MRHEARLQGAPWDALRQEYMEDMILNHLAEHENSSLSALRPEDVLGHHEHDDLIEILDELQSEDEEADPELLIERAKAIFAARFPDREIPEL